MDVICTWPLQERNRETFHGAIDLFKQRDTRKRGSVEFIRAALKNMRPFGVHRDIESYRALVDIMPKVHSTPHCIQGYLLLRDHMPCTVDFVSCFL